MKRKKNKVKSLPMMISTIRIMRKRRKEEEYKEEEDVGIASGRFSPLYN